jgi:hypothetical protein
MISMLAIMKRCAAFLFATFAISAIASGPISPLGWNGSNEPSYGSGQSCCIPADLNGTGLIGGAFVLVSDSKSEFAVFALTYTPPLKPHWQLLERHSMSKLSTYTVTVEPKTPGPNAGIKVCATVNCTIYYLPTKASKSFKKGSAS